jgi:hypothetical protein
MRITNKTVYRTADLRSFFSAGLRAMHASNDKDITVVHARGGPSGHASIGMIERHGPGYRRYEGSLIRMRLPPPATLDIATVARVFEHEVLHNLGVEHADMTSDQRHGRGGLPDWAKGRVLAVAERAAREPTLAMRIARAEKRVATCDAGVAKHVRQKKLAKAWIATWRRRRRAAKRQLARLESVRTAPTACVHQEPR